ncbi:MAG: twin-arginine translocase subunit TatC [Bacteroidetes bacterium]|nr:MAG: twin-arginine translocase subunit TatC [Bacteroidota bacterium]
MSFLDHLEELRMHIIRSVIAILAFAVLAFINNDILFDQILFGPKRIDFWTYRALGDLGQMIYGDDRLVIKEFGFDIINITMAGQFTSHMFISIIAGAILAFPYILFEVWRFIKPALNAKEKNNTTGLVFYGTLLFLAGLLFGYYFLSPISVNFMGSYTVSDSIRNQITLSSYLNFVATLSFGSALLFELPMVVYFLAKVGVLTAEFMRKYRRYAVVIILLISAIVTPPDIASQVLMTIPIYGLYELGIFIAARVERKNALKNKTL